MDGISLDQLLAEIQPALVGRHLGRPRSAGAHALVLEVSGERERRLWLDAGRGAAGLYLLSRDLARALQEGAEPSVPGRTRQALLHLRKRLDGARILRLERIPGERTLVLETSHGVLVLRLSGPAPALTLAVGEAALATLGEGPVAWPPPRARPEHEWDRIDPPLFAAQVEEARAAGRSLPRAIVAVCPTLGPLLARQLDGSADSLAALRARLANPRPTLLAPAPLERCHDADLAPADAVALAPIPLAPTGRVAIHPPSWTEAAALFLRARSRGARFARQRREVLEGARRGLRRLVQLEAHLVRDLAGLPEAAALRRQGEALLASSASAVPGSAEIEVPDPYASEVRLRITLDPALTLPANADRLFAGARRIERARGQVGERLAETRRALEEAREREARALEARNVSELRPVAAPPWRRSADAEGGGPRHYLSSRGLSILVGRGARENHHLTFSVARPEDVWLHARDVPGAHVILRDNEARASADDLREAAEVAAFFSEARGEGRVDVHATRRKHVRPARGGLGRVVIGHSDTLRVMPRDPEGRLRRR